MRELNQLSQQNMADKLQMSINGYSKIERGETRLTVERMKQIAEIFKIDVTELLHEEEKHCILVIGEQYHSNNGHNIQIQNHDYMENQIELEKLRLLVQHQQEILA